MSTINIPTTTVFSLGNWVARQFSQRNLLVCGTSTAAGVAVAQLALSTDLFKQRKYFDYWESGSLSLRHHSTVVLFSAVALYAIASRVTPLFNLFLSLNFEQVADHCATACIGIGATCGGLYFSSHYQLRLQTMAPYLKLEKREAAPPKDQKPKGAQLALAKRTAAPRKEDLLEQQQQVDLPPELWQMILPLFDPGIFFYEYPGGNIGLKILKRQLTTLALVCKAWKDALYSIDHTLSPPKPVSLLPFSIYTLDRELEGISFRKMQQILTQLPNAFFRNLTLTLHPADDPKEIGEFLTHLIQQKRLQRLFFEFKGDARGRRKIAAVLSHVEGHLLTLSYGTFCSEEDDYPLRSDQAIEVDEFYLSGPLDKDKKWRNCILGMVKMKNLSIDDSDEGCQFSGPELTEILSQQPQLKNLDLGFYGDGYPGHVYKDFSFGNCALEELSIRLKSFDCESLKKALATQSCLKKISLKYVPQRISRVSERKAFEELMPTDLELFAATPIEEVHFKGSISTSVYDEKRKDWYTPLESFESEARLHLFFRNMPCLKILYMHDMEYLTGTFLKGLQLEELYLEMPPYGAEAKADLNIIEQAVIEMTTLKKLYVNRGDWIDWSDWLQEKRTLS